MQKSDIVLAVMLAIGAMLTACSYAPVPGATNTATYTTTAGAGEQVR